MSRHNHRKDGNLISHVWENITTVKIAEGRYEIHHCYQYRHAPEETYRPENSNIFEAAGHLRKVVRKTFKNGSLDLLEQQVEKMFKQGYFMELGEEEILQLATTPHLFTYFNYVYNSNSQSTPY